MICRDYDLLFTHVPKTGGSFVGGVLAKQLGGRMIKPKHLSFRRTVIEDPPSIRVFAVREPVSWYRSYWAYARAAVGHPRAWPIWEGGDVRHPTFPLDDTCGHQHFEQFVRNVLETFPEGFLRSVYCDFLNGATHVMRHSHLREDLEALLKIVGYDQPAVVHGLEPANVGEQRWKDKTILPRRLERRLREVENLDGLDLPYIHAF
jgi:hypothetical protein